MASTKKIDFNKVAMKAAGLAGGSIAAKAMNPLFPNLDPMVRGGLKIAIGVALPMFVPKNELISSVGDGFVAVGSQELVAKFVPTLAGIGDIDGIGSADVIDGIGYAEEVAGVYDEASVYGVEDISGAEHEDISGTDSLMV